MTIQLGLAAVYSLARPGSAISGEAQAVQQVASNVVKSVETSRALFGRKGNAISELSALASECVHEGWDGEDARPIDPQAVSNAIAFLRALPDSLPLPEMAAEPDGAVSLDWIRSRNRLLSVSIGASDRLAFAWLDGSDRGHGVARFVGGVVPTRIAEGVIAIMDLRNAAVRAA